MDARDLIRQRRAETENKAVEHEVERSEQLERDHTGQPFKYVGRNPATGEIQISNGDVRLSAYSVSNSELTPNTELQVLDSGIGNPTVNFAPHHPRRPVEPPQSSEEFTGTYAVLLDSIVEGEATPSCRKLTDIWALFAIVQYIKQARVMVLFSFPVDTGSPVPYACPRYSFGTSFVSTGIYESTCNPVADVDAPYDSYGECASNNPVTCGGDGFPPGLPLIDGYPGGDFCANAGSVTSPGGTGFVSSYGDPFGNAPGVKTYQTQIFEVTEPAVTDPNSTMRPERKRYRFVDLKDSPSYPPPEWNPRLINTWTSKSIYKDFFDSNGRAPKCGDTITVTENIAIWSAAPVTYVKDCSGSPISQSGGDETGIQFSTKSTTYSWQLGGGYYGFMEVTYSNGCGAYGTPPPPNLPLGNMPPPPSPPECQPEEGEPSEYERQFWVGGHLQTPIKLISINAEEQYEYFGSLMPDGYYVTLKWGRKLVNGKEEWCKVQTFKTTNLVDWRTESYHESKDLEPTKPSGTAGTLIDTKNDRVNLTETALIEINPTQNVTGAGNITRTLNKEILTRPEGSFVNTQITAKLDYTPNDGSMVQYNVPIYRIVQVIPPELNTGTIGCIEVGQVELAYSPLFSIPN
jgi:hypothetical protein